MLDVQHYHAALKKSGINPSHCTAAWEREVDGDLESGYVVVEGENNKYIRCVAGEVEVQTLAKRYDIVARLQVLDAETGQAVRPAWVLDPFELQSESIAIEDTSFTAHQEDVTEIHTLEKAEADNWDVDQHDED